MHDTPKMSSSTLKTVAKEPWVITEMKLDRVTCQWTIPSAQLLSKKNGKALWSPLFYTSEGKQQWKLGLYPRGVDQTCVNSVSFFLHLHSADRLGIQAKFKISILKSNIMIFKRKFKHKFDRLEGSGSPILMEQSKVLGPDCSEITIIVQCNIGAVISEEQKLSPDFSDITITVGDHKLRAHRSTLSLHSSVFAAMFNHKAMNENHDNEVKIENMEPAVIEGMLEYMYTGRVVNIKGIANGLLEAAEMFDLRELKDVCVETILETLDVDSAAEILSLANVYRASKLKKSTMKFIRDHINDVLETDGYKKMTHLASYQDINSVITE